eukprot:2146806-Prymnesium_polylepis.1
MVSRKAVLEHYVALLCLWHGVGVVERSNRQSPCAALEPASRHRRGRVGGSARYPSLTLVL